MLVCEGHVSWWSFHITTVVIPSASEGPAFSRLRKQCGLSHVSQRFLSQRFSTFFVPGKFDRSLWSRLGSG